MKCNKMWFESIKNANSYVRSAKSSKHKDSVRGKLRPYKCNDCDGYHLTSMSKKEQKIATKRSTETFRKMKIKNAIEENPTIDNLIELSEDWMTFHYVEEPFHVSFDINGHEKQIRIFPKKT